jgi:hypothetical protein
LIYREKLKVQIFSDFQNMEKFQGVPESLMVGHHFKFKIFHTYLTLTTDPSETTDRQQNMSS